MFRALLVLCALHLLQRLVNYIFNVAKPGPFSGDDAQTPSPPPPRNFNALRILVNALLTIIAAGIILEIWGLPVSWLLTTPLTLQVFSRAGIIVAAICTALVLIQISRVFTTYLLQSYAAVQEKEREAGRKMRTLAPLIHTVISLLALFVTGLVVLEQVGVDTAPVVAGIGIFGLACWFCLTVTH